MSLPTPTKNDIEAADETMRDYSQPNSSVDANLFFAATVYRAQFNFERALALKLVEVMQDVRSELSNSIGIDSEWCIDRICSAIEAYKQATGIGEQEEGK